MLWGCLISIINTTLIELSTTVYLFAPTFIVLFKDSTLCTDTQEWPKANLLHWRSTSYMKLKSSLPATTLRPTARIVVHLCSSTATPSHPYSRVRWNAKPLCRSELNALLSAEILTLRIRWKFLVDHTRIVSSQNETYVAWSQRCMREAIIYVCNRLNSY